MFTYPLKKIHRFSVMNDCCPVCGVHLSPEPGFYQGAMFVAYAFIVMVVVAVSIVLSMVGDFSPWVYSGVVVGTTFILAPLNFRYSRVVYLYFFGGIKFRG